MNYAAIKTTDIANGPGVRVSLFVSGCRRHCKNCFNKETWDFGYGNKLDKGVINEILDALDKPYIEGFSLLGGEPFEKENRPTCLDILKKVKKRFPDKTVWCYTGFTYEELVKDGQGGVSAEEMLKHIDVLVDGEFIEEKKNLKLEFRGSENQRLIDMKKTLENGKITLLAE